MSKIADEIAQLKQEVAEVVGVEKSAVTLLEGIKQKLDEAVEVLKEEGANVEALEEISAELDASSNALASAVAANQVPPVD